MRRPLPSLSALSAEILAEVQAEKQAKLAASTEKTAAAPVCNTELGTLLYKLSAELRAASEEVSYDDLLQFAKGRGQ